MKKLYDLEPEEVSLVGKGANKKKFLIYKSIKGKQMAQREEIRRMLESVPAAQMAKVEKVIKELATPAANSGMKPEDNPPGKDSAAFKAGGAMPEQAQAALKAIARIAAPHKDVLTKDHINSVLGEVGFGDGEKQPGEAGHLDMPTEQQKAVAYPEKVSDEHSMEALDMAKKAYSNHLEKLGYKKYPDESMAMKSKEEMAKAKQKEEDDKAKGGENVDKVAKSDLDLSAFTDKQKPQIEAIFKGFTDKQKELVKKNEDLESQLKDRDEKEKEREYVSKADSLTHLNLPKADIVSSLRDAAKAGKEAYERITKQYETLNEQGKASNIFKEAGSSRGNEGGATGAEAKLNALVDSTFDSIVRKGDTKITKAMVYDEVMQTPEGRRLYRESQTPKRGNI